jgi:hypothetical protein
MEAIYDWNEYCEQLEDLTTEVSIPEEDVAYHLWLQRETARFDAEQIERFIEILMQPPIG